MQRLIRRIIARIPFLFRYGVSGGTGAVIQLGADAIAVELLGLWYMYGVVVGFLIALAVTFLMQKYWTFREHSREHARRQFVLYTTMALCMLGANIVFMYIFVELFHVWYLFAQIMTVVLVAGSSFLFHNFVTFAHAKERL